MKTRLHRRCTFLAASGALIYSQLCCYAADSDANGNGQSAVVLGPAIVNECRRFQLLGPVSLAKGNSDSNLMFGNYQPGVNFDQAAFSSVREWFIKNVFPKISNRTINRPANADCYLFLYSKTFPLKDLARDATGSMLLDVPLTQEILGPNYIQKIEQLRDLMISDYDLKKDSAQMPPANMRVNDSGAR